MGSDWSFALGLGLMVIGGIALGIRGLGIIGEAPSQILNVPLVEVGEALKYRGSLKGPLRIDGALTSPDPVFMPDTGEPVLRSYLSIHLEGMPKSGVGSTQRRTLYREDDLAPIELGSGTESIAMVVRPFELPLFHDLNVQVSEIFDDDQLVKVLYGDWSFEVDPKEWEGQDIAVKVNRAYLPIGLKVAVMGALNGQGDRPQLQSFEGLKLEVLEQPPGNLPPQRRDLGALALVLGIGGLVSGGWFIRRAVHT